jgi:hypothetical protein
VPATTDDARLAEDERRAEEIYDRHVRPTLRPEDEGKYVAVAVESGDFEIDADDYAATGRLLARRPGTRLWLMRVGPAVTDRGVINLGSEATVRLRTRGPAVTPERWRHANALDVGGAGEARP